MFLQNASDGPEADPERAKRGGSDPFIAWFQLYSEVPPMTKDQIKSLLLSNDRAVERAMCALFARQTQDERSSSTTQHLNGRGFNAFDAPTGSYYARWVNSGRKLTGRHLDKARAMAIRYAGQLVEVALGNQRATLVVVKGRTLGELLARHDPFQPFPGVTQGL